MVKTTVKLKREKGLIQSIILENFPINRFYELTEGAINTLFEQKYYMYKVYDKVTLINLEFIITKLTRSSITLLIIS